MRDAVYHNPSRFDDWTGLLSLLNKSFAFMEGRIDPRSSLLRMTVDDLQDKARQEDLFLVLRHGAPVACLFGQPKGDHYYIGKLAVDAAARQTGLARALVDAAAQEAVRRGARGLELQTRVELRENHRAFRAMGFKLVGASAHDGYEKATSFIFRRSL